MSDTGTPADPLRVLVADDHPIFLAGMRQLLDASPGLSCVAAVADGPAAVRAAVAERPDVAVLDIGMPELSGVDATRAIAAAAPTVGVLMLTMLADDDSVFAALRAGARGYLVKGALPDEVVTAIRTVASGGAVFGADVAARILTYFASTPGPGAPRPSTSDHADRPGAPTAPETALAGLTEREREILSHVADGATNTAIAARLFLSPKTVRNHVSNILTKLQLADRRQAMLHARRSGLGTPPL